jgi:hypothetical protein
MQDNIENNAENSGVNLEDVIKSSKAKLETTFAESTQTPSAPSEKRRPGRSKGWRKYPQGKAKEKPNDGPLPSGARPINPQVMQSIEITPLATEVVKLPFDYVGATHDLNLTPTESEAQTPAKYLSKLIECYVPDLDQKDPKVFNLVAFLISYALLAIKKGRIFFEHKKKNKPDEKKENKEQEESPEQNKPPFPTSTSWR